MQFSLLSLAVLAGVAVASPLVERQSNGNSDGCTGNSTHYQNTADAGAPCLFRPSDCTQFQPVLADDTCDSLAQRYNSFTESIFNYWNPDIGVTCFGLQAFTTVCTAVPWYTFGGSIQNPEGTVKSADNPLDLPIPQMPSIVSNCNKFELAGGGFTVASIEAQNNISNADFLAWNPYIDSTNPVAWAGYWVCVGVSS